MNQQVKTKWLEALRSGDYQQTQGKLKDTNGFCCLGVLCDLYRKENAINWEEYPVDNAYRLYDESCTLPEQVMDWSGLQESNPVLVYDEGGQPSADLARLNDDGLSFNNIASLIEDQL